MRTDVFIVGKLVITKTNVGPSTIMITLTENVHLDALSSRMSTRSRSSLVTVNREKIMVKIMIVKQLKGSIVKVLTAAMRKIETSCYLT